jgi:hypothetical protein
MDLRREEAINNYMEIIPTMEAFIPAMVDARNLGARRQQVIELVSRGPFVPVFEAKYAEALVALTTEEIEQITALFALQPRSLLTTLLKWASGLAWAATELAPYIEREYERLLPEDIR